MKLLRNIALFVITLTLATASPALAADSVVPKDYPLKTCVVSDEKLGEHGKPVKVTSKGTDVWLCCKMCIKDFKKDPDKYTKMVTDAAAKK